MSGDVPRPPRPSRRQAPAHITLPSSTIIPSAVSTYSPNERFKHTFPATPGFSATPASERPNPFFILNEEIPLAPIYPLSLTRIPPKTPPARRPALPPQVSLEHAFGVVRTSDEGRKDDFPSGNQRFELRLGPPSPVPSCSSSKCEVRSQPDMSEVEKRKKKKKNRPRSSTTVSAPAANVKLLLETPSFRSSGAGTPRVGTPRNISISEIPLFPRHGFGRPEDVFGLAAVQPPRLTPRRPVPLRRQTVQVLTGVGESGIRDGGRKAVERKKDGPSLVRNEVVSCVGVGAQI